MSDATPTPSHYCGAKTRSGRPCTQPAMPNGRCKLHGGKTPARIGPHSKYLPTRLAEKANEAWADANLISRRKHLAILEAFIADNLEQMETRPPEEAWADALKAITQMEVAIKGKDPKGLTDALAACKVALTEGDNYMAAQVRVRAMLIESARLTEAELKRLDKLAQYMTAQQAQALCASIIDIIKRHLSTTAPKTVQLIANDIARLADQSNAG